MALSPPPKELYFMNSSSTDDQDQPRAGSKMRAHVRRRNLAVLQYERIRQGDNFTVFTDRDKDNLLSKKSCKPKGPQRTVQEQTDTVSQCASQHSSTRKGKDNVNLGVAATKLGPVKLAPYHPYTSCISGTVQLSERAIDLLFKSRTFQIVAEPLFCANHVDSDANMVAVFPECFSNVAYIYALLHSIMAGIEDAHSSRTALLLKKLAMEHLQRDLQSLDRVSLDILVGTVLLLSGTAYRSNQLLEHEAHSSGLVRLIEYGMNRGQQLRVATKRVVFWQDLIGAACIGSKRRFCHTTFPEISLDMEATPPITQLPEGFSAHHGVLIPDLRDCLMRIVSLQALYESRDPEARNFTVLDKWQASIESRLVFLTDTCNNTSSPAGVISECCRLAAYICCYSVYTEVWKSSFIPLKHAEKLISRLSETMDDSIWTLRRDLFLWLVFVCTCTIQTAELYARYTREKHDALMERLAMSIQDWDGGNGECTMLRALEKFIYVDDWLERRFSNRQWLAIELGFSVRVERR